LTRRNTMFEQYVSSLVILILIVMLVTLVLLATLLESLGRRCHASDVVGIMGMTSVITACLVSLCILFLAYGPIGKGCKHDMPAAGLGAEHTSAGEGPRASEAYLHERSDVSPDPLIHAPPEDESD
jgi:hypothetical protein